ncbi:hypothetical protein HYU94_01015 [Candidatus Daviesbacteria bacterium]|nr:hypothetical protein [Candidatus Daviesbacteria bacterium]
MTENISFIQSSLSKVFGKPHNFIITLAVALNVLFAYYLVLIQKTTWDAFWQSNALWFVWSQIALSVIFAILAGIAVSFFFYVIETKKSGSEYTSLNTIGSLIFSAAVTGCSVCSAFLLPALGITASLAAFPFGGLEIKLFAILIISYAIWQYSKSILGRCDIAKEKKISLALLAVFIFSVYAIPRLPIKYRAKTQKATIVADAKSNKSQTDSAEVFAQINPNQGIEINAKYSDIGPKMIEMGVIDLEKFKSLYQQSGKPLTPEQEEILTRGKDIKIKITQDNSYFLLNFFWAFGLGNKTKILTEGDMVKYGQGQVGNFASTGGWTLAKGVATNYYSKRALVPLTAEQEDLVNKVASNIYRPCCGNSTAFPDCNHGMALLGILELMASNGATEDEMYNGAKYINAFWFPNNYYDAAIYFKNKEGKDYKDVDARTLLGKDISSAQGMQTVKRWLIEQGLVAPPPKSGGGCGV